MSERNDNDDVQGHDQEGNEPGYNKNPYENYPIPEGSDGNTPGPGPVHDGADEDGNDHVTEREQEAHVLTSSASTNGTVHADLHGETSFEESPVEKPKVRLMDAVDFAFAAVFRNPLVILSAFLFLLFMVLISFLSSMGTQLLFGPGTVGTIPAPGPSSDMLALFSISMVAQLLVIIISVIGTVYFYHAGIKALTIRKLSTSDMSGVRLFPGIGASILAGLVQIVIFFLMVLVFLVPVAIFLLWGVSDINVIVPRVIVLIIAYLVLSLFATPFGVMAIAYAVDGNSVTDSVVKGLRAGRDHYWTIFGYTLLVSVVGVLFMIVTVGLGAMIVLPISVFIVCHLYCQIENKECTTSEDNRPNPAFDVNAP